MSFFERRESEDKVDTDFEDSEEEEEENLSVSELGVTMQMLLNK